MAARALEDFENKVELFELELNQHSAQMHPPQIINVVEKSEVCAANCGLPRCEGGHIVFDISMVTVQSWVEMFGEQSISRCFVRILGQLTVLHLCACVRLNWDGNWSPG